MSQLIPKGHENLLEREIAFYERNRTEFLSKHPGRFLLIFGENLEGVFNEVDDAIKEGIHKFGMDPFLVRKSGEDTPVFHVPFKF